MVLIPLSRRRRLSMMNPVNPLTEPVWHQKQAGQIRADPGRAGQIRARPFGELISEASSAADLFELFQNGQNK